tara:strand:- start:1186 stop:3078 length:1893 start_codon:yes stop_codon:yes gene_type:complete
MSVFIDLEDNRRHTPVERNVANLSVGNERFYKFFDSNEDWWDDSSVGNYYEESYDAVLKELKDRGIDEINETYNLITSFLENPTKESKADYNSAVKEVYANVIPQLADTSWTPALKFSERNTEEDPYRFVANDPSSEEIVDNLTTALSVFEQKIEPKFADLKPIWEGLNQRQDADLAREALFKYDPEGFKTAVENLEPNPVVVESGTPYAGDTTTSNQAWQRTATDKRFGYEIEDVPPSQRVGRNQTTVRGLQELAAARRGESIVDAETDDIDLSGLTAADFGVAAEGAPDAPMSETEKEPQIPTGPTADQIMAEREADRDEIYSLLQEQFGGASYFFREHATNMLLGVTADGTIVSYDDESAESQIGLMDYIVNNGITSMTRVKGLLQKTEWWQTTDVARRTYDVMWGEMSDPERKEFLEPTTDALTKEAQFLGFDLTEEDAFTLAQTLAQNGDSEDTEAIREMIIGQLANYEITNEFSDFSAGRDALEQLAYKYYVPQTEETAQDWAEKIYTGEATQTEYEQYLKATAVSRFPTLDKVINQMGITPDQYFSPYKYQIEQMLGRQVDMLDEFSDVIEYIPDAGANARPMTLSEVRNFVRALPEWQQTDDAKDQARALAFSIGQTFGEVA